MKALRKIVLGLALALMVLLAACSQNPLPQETLEPEIVGGTTATAGAYPWMARLVRNGTSFCGGSLLHQSWVITAAHCVDGSVTAASLSVILGDHQGSVNEGTEQSRGVAEIILHPNFSAATLNNDLALLRLSTPATLNARVVIARIAALPDVGTSLRVIGWGRTFENGLSADRLQQVNVPLVSNINCNNAYPGQITDSMFCAGLPQGTMDACQGDSGGPIFLPNTRYLVGLVSWGTGCARPELFGVYTDLARFNTFIYSFVPRPATIRWPMSVDLVYACRYSQALCDAIKNFKSTINPPSIITVNPCKDFPDLCVAPVTPDPICVQAICNNPMEFSLDGNYHIGFAISGISQTPSQFAQNFRFELADSNGKLLTQGKPNAKTPLLEFSSALAKGKYNLRVTVINKDIAKLMQTAPEKYSFGFLIETVK